jgi:hypothetical protein
VRHRQPQGFELGMSRREPEGHALELAQRAVELAALGGVAYAGLQRAASQAEQVGGLPDPRPAGGTARAAGRARCSGQQAPGGAGGLVQYSNSGDAGGVTMFLASIINLATAVVNRRGTSRKPSSGGGQE